MFCSDDGIVLEMKASDNIADQDSKAAQRMRTMQFVIVIVVLVVRCPYILNNTLSRYLLSS